MSDPKPIATNREPDAQVPARARAIGLLVLALVVIVVARLPLVVFAHEHLDSDLAVDGLTLLDLTHGQWQWHFPGTPYMGIPPALLSLPAAWLAGANPTTLVTGGVIAYVLLAAAVFTLAWRAFGRSAACWCLVPLAFSSTGVLWLSARITGGHLLIVAWWAWSLLLLHALIERGGLWRAGLLGLWCGLGLYIDRMFVSCLIGLGLAAVACGIGRGRVRARFARVVVGAVGLTVGFLPYTAGLMADDYDAYTNQFQTIFVRDHSGRILWPMVGDLATKHSRILALECLPRLITGYKVVQAQGAAGPGAIRGLQAEPSPEGLGASTRMSDVPTWNLLAIGIVAGGFLLFLAASVELVRRPAQVPPNPLAAIAVRLALILTSAATVGGFLINYQIFNSDNYRYLVLLIVPYALGVGLVLDRLARAGRRGRIIAGALGLTIAVAFALDTAGWYRRFGWLGAPAPVRREDPALAWLRDHPEVLAIYGGYWDIYRLSFLTSGRVRGRPYPEDPNRFPRWSSGWEGDRPRVLVARSDGLGRYNRDLALREGATPLAERPGLWILDWPFEPEPAVDPASAPAPRPEPPRANPDLP